MVWEMTLYNGRVKVGTVRLNSAPRIEQIVEVSGRRYSIVDQSWESLGVTKKPGDPDFIGAALVESPEWE